MLDLVEPHISNTDSQRKDGGLGHQQCLLGGAGTCDALLLFSLTLRFSPGSKPEGGDLDSPQPW